MAAKQFDTDDSGEFLSPTMKQKWYSILYSHGRPEALGIVKCSDTIVRRNQTITCQILVIQCFVHLKKGDQEWPQYLQTSHRHSNSRASRLASTQVMSRPDGLGPLCCTGASELMRPPHQNMAVETLVNSPTTAEWLGSLPTAQEHAYQRDDE